MLSSISIRNLVNVTALELEFHPGMTALTGETGAGKSILIDAIGLALGDKSYNSLIREGVDQAEVSLGFDLGDCPEAIAWLKEQDMDTSDGQCLLRRVLKRDARSRSYINGVPVPVSQVQALGVFLLGIHGQHAHQALMQTNQQRSLLDAYAGLTATRQQLASLYHEWQQSQQALERLRQVSNERLQRLDLLRFQLAEFDRLDLRAQELDELDEEHERLSHAGRLQQGSAQVLAMLAESETDIRSGLSHCLQELQELSSHDKALNDPAEALDTALIQVDEAARSLRRYLDQLELDPGRLAEVEQRLSSIHDLARKHRLQPHELLHFHQAVREELAQLEDADASLEQLLARSQATMVAYEAAAMALRKERMAAGKRLSAEVTASMQALAMTGGRFEVRIEPLELEGASAHGLERIEFLVSANPGQALSPLAKTASGGELSRISLALQVATADCSTLATLIFDEVDVGIGGGVAEIVGRLMRRLGKDRQVMCVTHLAQVASQAHEHYQVSKSTEADQTRTHIQRLDEEARVTEIARMLAGVEITQSSLAHAREMIGRAGG
jgi:DNA repair protein RecN (Recombination protein N)